MAFCGRGVSTLVPITSLINFLFWPQGEPVINSRGWEGLSFAHPLLPHLLCHPPPTHVTARVSILCSLRKGAQPLGVSVSKTACVSSQVSEPGGNRWFPPNCLQEDKFKERLLTREKGGPGDIGKVWGEQDSGISTSLCDGVWRGGRGGQKGAAMWGQASDKGPFFLRELGQCLLS